MREVPIQERNRRNNVAATIFQIGFHYSNTKSRYRALAMHKLWAYWGSDVCELCPNTKYVGKLRESMDIYAQNSILSLKFIITEQITIKISNFNYKTNKFLKLSQFLCF